MRWIVVAVVLAAMIGCAGNGDASADGSSETQTDYRAAEIADIGQPDAPGEVDRSADPVGDYRPEAEVAAAVPDPGQRLREAGWLRGDMHLHTTYSDGEDEMATVIGLAEYLGHETFVAAHPEYQDNHLDFIVITDHRTLDGMADPDFVSDELILVSGMEFGGPGHAGVWGISELVHHDPDGDGATLDDYLAAVENVHDQGGCFSPNHPFTPGIYFAWDVRTHDAIEVWNAPWATGGGEATPEGLAGWEGGHGPAGALFKKGMELIGSGRGGQALHFYEAGLARGVHVALVGGSDRHAVFPVGFPTTYLRSKTQDVAGLMAAVKARRTFVSRGPAAATVELTVVVGDKDFEMGDAIPISSQGTMVTVKVRVGRAHGGLLRLIVGHHIASDGELVDAELGKPILEVPVEGADFEAETVATIQPGDWLYPLVLEPVAAPGLEEDKLALIPDMAQAAIEAGTEDYDSLLNLFWDVIDFEVVLAPETCDPAKWQLDKLQCMPPDATGIATFFIPDWVNRVLNSYAEGGQATEWCVGAVGSAVLFEAAP